MSLSAYSSDMSALHIPLKKKEGANSSPQKTIDESSPVDDAYVVRSHKKTHCFYADVDGRDVKIVFKRMRDFK